MALELGFLVASLAINILVLAQPSAPKPRCSEPQLRSAVGFEIRGPQRLPIVWSHVPINVSTALSNSHRPQNHAVLDRLGMSIDMCGNWQTLTELHVPSVRLCRLP